MRLCKEIKGKYINTELGSKRKLHKVLIPILCRWTNLEESETSGVAVVEVHLPSGYYVMQDDLIRLVESRTVRNLRWAYRTTTQVKFFFNNVST